MNTTTRYPPRHPTTPPLWESVAAYALAAVIGVLAAFFLVIGLSS